MDEPRHTPAMRPDQPAPGLTPAPLLRRFGALMIDWILCLLIAGLFGGPVAKPWLPVLILIAEYGFFVGLFGMTPGMRLTRIRCVRFSDGGVIGIALALLRGVLLALFIPALIMDSNLRGLHDRAAGSIVVSAP